MGILLAIFVLVECGQTLHATWNQISTVRLCMKSFSLQKTLYQNSEIKLLEVVIAIFMLFESLLIHSQKMTEIFLDTYQLPLQN